MKTSSSLRFVTPKGAQAKRPWFSCVNPHSNSAGPESSSEFSASGETWLKKPQTPKRERKVNISSSKIYQKPCIHIEYHSTKTVQTKYIYRRYLQIQHHLNDGSLMKYSSPFPWIPGSRLLGQALRCSEAQRSGQHKNPPLDQPDSCTNLF